MNFKTSLQNEHPNELDDRIPDLKSGDEDFSNSVDEYESPDVSGFNEMSEPYY